MGTKCATFCTQTDNLSGLPARNSLTIPAKRASGGVPLSKAPLLDPSYTSRIWAVRGSIHARSLLLVQARVSWFRMARLSDEIDTSPVRIIAKFAGPRPDPAKKRAITWFDREAYSKFAHLLRGTFDFPPDYDEWNRLSEAAERYWISRGFQVIRVTVDPEGFSAWCSGRFVQPNRKTLEACINEKVFQGKPLLEDDYP